MNTPIFRASFEPGYTPPPALLEALAELTRGAARQMKSQALYDELSAHLADTRKSLEMLTATMCTEETLADTRQHIAACELVLAWLVHYTFTARAA